MANRELVVAVFADAGPFEKGMVQAANATKVLTYAVDDMAAKNVEAMSVQVAKLKELQAEYLRIGAAAKKGSLEAQASGLLLTNVNRKLGESVQTTGQLLDNISRKSVIFGRTMTTYVTAPLALLAAYSTKMFIDFQRNMEMIHTQAGAPQSEVARQSQNVLNFASSGQSPVSPNQLSQGLFYIESRGLRGAAALKVMKIAADAAGMGMANMEDVANALGGAIVTGIKGTENYSKAMGIISATVGNGAMHMQDYAAALRTGVVPAAKAAGINLQELGAALDVLTDRGMPAQMAATRLRMTFSMMESPTKAATKALGELGISHYQLANLLHSPTGLLQALELLQAAIDRSKDKTKAYDLVLQAFGKGRSSAGILTLLNSLDSSTSSFQLKLAQIQEQQHNFTEEVAAYHRTASFQIQSAWSAVQADLIKLGGALAPAVVTLAHGIKDVVSGFTSLPGPIRQVIGVSAILLATIGPIALIFGKGMQAAIALGGVVRGLVAIFTGSAAAENAALASTAASEEGVAAAATATAATVETSAGAQVTAWASVEGAMVPVIAEETVVGDTALAQVGKVVALRSAILSLGGAAVLGALAALGAGIVLALKGDSTGAGTVGKAVGSTSKYPILDLLMHDQNFAPKKGTGVYDEFKALIYKTITKSQAEKWFAAHISQTNAQGGDIPLSMAGGATGSGFIPSGGGGNPGRGYGAMTAGKAKMLAFARDALGKPYVWGGSGPNSFDCSGLVMWAFANGLNMSIPHSTYSQVGMGKQTATGYGGSTSTGRLHVGDVVFTQYGESGKSGPGHEGLVVGYDASGNPIIEAAPHPGGVVSDTSLSTFDSGGTWSARDLTGQYGMSTRGYKFKMPGPIGPGNNPMAKYLHAAAADSAAAAAKKKAEAAAKKAGDAAAAAIIDDIRKQTEAAATAVSVAIKSGANPSSIAGEAREEVNVYERDIEKVKADMKGANSFERAKLADELAKLKNGLQKAQAEVTHEVKVMADQAVKNEAAGWTSQYQQFSANLKLLQQIVGYKIPGVTTDYVKQLSKSLVEEHSDLVSEISKVKSQIKSATGPRKTALRSLLQKLQGEDNNVESAIEQGLKDNISTMQTAYDTAKQNFDSAYNALTSEIQSMFQEQTQDYITNVLGPKYFQGGVLTPQEQALKTLQDTMKDEQLQKAVRDATLNMVNNMSSGADIQTILNDEDAIKQAQNAITEDQLSTDATASRTKADKDYAAAVKTYQDNRTAEEHQLVLSMNDLQKQIDDGTGSLSGLNDIMGKYGVTLDGSWKQLYQIDYPAASAAFNGPGGLVDATSALQNAFIALVTWVNAHTGSNVAVTVAPRTGPSAPTNGGTNAPSLGTSNPYVIAQAFGHGAIPQLAAGGVVRSRPGGMLAMIGEGGEDELVAPLSSLGGKGGGDIHIHFDGTVIGNDLTKAARELEPHIRSAIVRTQRRNATSGII